MTKTLYTAQVAITGGRDGRARSGDGRLDLALALPATMGGSADAANPEQLFAAGFGACFASSLAHAARVLQLAPGPVTVDAQVALTVDDVGAFGLAVRLAARLPGLSPAEAATVVTEAKRICAYSNATRGNVALQVDLI